MFHRHRKIKLTPGKSLKDLTRIVPSSLLLGEEKRSLLLQQIKERSALEDVRFDSLCLSLIHNLTNHCQNLPESSASYYAQQGGVLDYALNRTEAALGLFQNYLLNEEQDNLSEEQKLWQYALLSAALLQGVGKLQIDYSINLYDNNGQFLKQWNPVLENLIAVGSHYSYEFQKETDEEFRCRLNLLLARLLMPASGFAWIASNTQVLAIWLALLNEDTEAAGTLGAILVRADAIAIQRYFNQLSLGAYGGARGIRYGRANTFGVGVPESPVKIENQVGIEFIQWLLQSLESGRIMVNKAPLFMVPGGLLISPEMFKWFVREHPEFKNWQAVQNGFLSLGLHRLAARNDINSRFEQSSNQQIHSGIVFADYATALPDKIQLHHLHTGKSTSISAVELIYQEQAISSQFTRQHPVHSEKFLPYLNKKGQWQVESRKTAAFLRPGVPYGG
ncbi:TraI domain-containing protein [Legionella fairfieldensis]|uniref:TraI domain-containing protein n=1 Tax=Legionella fairfieldensis TaxID=45064 RepID=UPI00048AEACA|nr:TraI domain-containing protein [Legionella fairfieldensis]